MALREPIREPRDANHVRVSMILTDRIANAAGELRKSENPSTGSVLAERRVQFAFERREAVTIQFAAQISGPT